MHDGEETLDAREFLPHGVPVVNKYRQAQPDMALESRYVSQDIRYNQAHILNVMNYLHDRGTLNDEQIANGQTYEIWRNIYLAARGFVPRLPANLSLEPGKNYGEEGYGILLTCLPLYHHKALQQALELATGHNRFVADQRRTAYRISFQALVTTMPHVWETLKAREETKKRLAAAAKKSALTQPAG